MTNHTNPFKTHTQNTTCPKCGTPVITALDNNPCGIPTTLEPGTLTNQQETQALLTNRPTYQTHGNHKQQTIQHRNHWQITAQPANTTNTHTTHKCGKPISNQQTHKQTTKHTTPTKPPY
jgi:hypothetical protein